MKAMIYARYSTDKQSESSIEDQVRLCMVRVEFEGWQLAGIHKDEGVSGSVPVARRVGGVKLLSDLMACTFDVLVLESLDRLSRDMIEQEKIIRRLEHRRIRVLGLSDGYDSNQESRQLVRGMRGLINEMYLEDLRKKTHRGMSGQIIRGFAAGAASYGYKNIKVEGGSEIQIDEEAAEWVRWIFEAFAAGRSPQSIVFELNERRVKSPRGSTWGVSSVYGSPSKGSGVLNNELYRGRHIWNRSQWVKDPDTGRRKRIERPESEWTVNQRDDLRIVTDELWDKVRARFKGSRLKTGTKGRGGRVRSLFGGLMSCDKCDAPIVVVSSHSYGCSNRMNRGPSVCEGVNVNRTELEATMLAEVADLLSSDELVGYACAETMKLLELAGQDKCKSRDVLPKRIAELNEEITRYIEAIGSIGISGALADKLKRAELEKQNCLDEMDIDIEKFNLVINHRIQVLPLTQLPTA